MDANPTQVIFLELLLKILQPSIPYASTHTGTNVIACGGFLLKQMWWLKKVIAGMKREHRTKSWNWNICIKLALSAS